ncbi:uncharacterized protein BO80DRAFT_377204, partial [Aspergillus ibericus CBS 121593]
MRHAHNAMLRGLNSIYHQAPHLTSPNDITDFLFFVRSWAEWVSHHHVIEEERMFPGFERVIGREGYLGGEVEEHHGFQPLLSKLLEYGKGTKAGEYNPGVLKKMIEDLAGPFREHLAGEIETLLRMEGYGDGDKLLEVYKECEAEAGTQDKNVVPPMVLGLRDVTFEGGNNWPAMPPLSAWFVHYIFARKHAGAWRFLPCDTWGRPRQLAFGK